MIKPVKTRMQSFADAAVKIIAAIICVLIGIAFTRMDDLRASKVDKTDYRQHCVDADFRFRALGNEIKETEAKGNLDRLLLVKIKTDVEWIRKELDEQKKGK